MRPLRKGPAGWCLGLALVVAAGCAQAGDGRDPAEPGSPCSDAWYQSIEAQVPTGDRQGHGPDAGSAGWK